MKIICKGFSIRCTVMRRVKWNQPAILTLKAANGTLRLTRANVWGRVFHRQIPIQNLEVKQTGTILKCNTYRLDCERIMKARVMMKLIQVFQQFHQSIQQSKPLDCPICISSSIPVITLLPCQHKMCHQCYLKWPKTCPFCRKPIHLIQATL